MSQFQVSGKLKVPLFLLVNAATEQKALELADDKINYQNILYITLIFHKVDGSEIESDVRDFQFDWIDTEEKI